MVIHIGNKGFDRQEVCDQVTKLRGVALFEMKESFPLGV